MAEVLYMQRNKLLIKNRINVSRRFIVCLIKITGWGVYCFKEHIVIEYLSWTSSWSFYRLQISGWIFVWKLGKCRSSLKFRINLVVHCWKAISKLYTVFILQFYFTVFISKLLLIYYYYFISKLLLIYYRLKQFQLLFFY